MNALRLLRRQAGTLASVIALAVTPAAQSVAEPGRVGAPPTGPVIELTSADVDASNAKVRMAYGALVDMWSGDFRQRGERFAAPRIARYRSAIRTPCGVMEPNNAGYCAVDNTIYYDDVFVAAQAKRAARELGTDGDMAAVGVIAHEMGHAVAMQLGHLSRSAYENESTADCLAGAFAQRSEHDGSLERGDLDEAFYGMSTAGDPTPQLTGNERVDRRILRQVALNSHGTREQRMQNFRNGYEGGAGACLAELRA